MPLLKDGDFPAICHTLFAISDNLSGIRTEGQTLRGRRSRREVMVRCWALSQFPYLVGPDLTIYDEAPRETLKLLLLSLAGGSIILLLLPLLFYHYRQLTTRFLSGG